MSGKFYVGVNGTAQRVKRLYVGVNGVARKVRKLYVGVNGVAHKVFGGELSYYGTATPMSYGHFRYPAATVGNYAVFAGGQNKSGYTATANAYDASLTRSTPSNLYSGASAYNMAASVGSYALFTTADSDAQRCYVTAYDASLTRSSATDLSSVRNGGAGASVGNYALFAGGGLTATVDAYDTALTRTLPTVLSQARSRLEGATVGSYALFAGGSADYSWQFLTTVDAYDASLTRTTPTDLSVARRFATSTNGASVGGAYALFGGSDQSGTTVDAYNASLTRTTPTALSVGRSPVGITTDDFAIFATGDYKTTVDAYDSSLTRVIPTEVSYGRSDAAGAAVGDYAIIAGGATADGAYNHVEAYQIA